MSSDDFDVSHVSDDDMWDDSSEHEQCDEEEYKLENGNVVIPFHSSDIEPHPMQYSLSQMESGIFASTALPIDVCNIIAQYLLFDFILKMDRTMIEYMSCEETKYYKIENMFAFSRHPIFCSRWSITEFDVLIKLSLRNHPQTVQCIGDKHKFIQTEADDEPDGDITIDDINEINMDQDDASPFMVCSFHVISPNFCTAPLSDALIWVFNERPTDKDLSDRDLYNQRMDINQLEYDINTNWKQRDETKPVAFIKDPPRTKLVSYKLPFGILGKYVFIKCMAQGTDSDNTDVQYIGVTVARL